MPEDDARTGLALAMRLLTLPTFWPLFVTLELAMATREAEKARVSVASVASRT